jgi:hypothetical protein
VVRLTSGRILPVILVLGTPLLIVLGFTIALSCMSAPKASLDVSFTSPSTAVWFSPAEDASVDGPLHLWDECSSRDGGKRLAN